MLDLAVANSGDGSGPGTMSLLLGNGNGTFGPAVTAPVGRTPFAVAMADLDGDHRLDVVVFNDDSDNMVVMRGNGNGTVKPGLSFGTGAATGLASNCLVVADLNGDHRPDLAYVPAFDLGVLLNTTH